MEILVSAAITLLLAGALLALASNVLVAWNRASGTLETESQAEIILDQVAADLEAAVLRVDSQVWFAATVQNDQTGAGDAGMTEENWSTTSKPPGAPSLQLMPDSNRMADAHFGQAGMWLRFFTTQPDANDKATSRSAPRAISYQLIRRRNGAQSVYQLYRSQVRPGGTTSTFSVGYNLFSTAYTTPSGTAQNPGNIRRPNAQYLLGNNVADFGIKIFARGTDGKLARAFPVSNSASQSVLATTDAAAAPLGYAGKPVVRAFPGAVDVMVRVLTPDGMRLLANLETGLLTPPSGVSLGDYWWRLAESNSRIFVRHIGLRTELL